MKKKIIIVFILSVILTTLFPLSTLAASCTVSNFSYSPQKMYEPGGSCTLTFTLDNGSALTVNRYMIAINGVEQAAKDCNIAPGDSKTVSPSISITSAMLDSPFTVTIAVRYSNGVSKSIDAKNITINKIDDVIYSTNTSITPEKSSYMIGESIEIVDNFKNRATADALSCTVQYYKKYSSDIWYDEQTINLGSIPSGDSKNITYPYTFTAEDAGEIEIASIIRFTYAGGQREEYCVSHYFTVEDQVMTPEPTATPTLEITPTPEATPEPNIEEITGLLINVSVTDEIVAKGEDVIFSIEVQNTGTIDMDSIRVFDNDELIATLTDITAGDSARYLYTVTMDKTTAFNFSAKTKIVGKNITAFADIVKVEVDENARSASVHGSSANTSNLLIIAALIAGGVIILSLIVVIVLLATRKKQG